MKILVLAGGSDQIALITELKKYRHEVILVDYYESPPAREYVDKHIVASTLDVSKVKEIAIEESVDLITTACTDQALLTVAQVSEQLLLPCYISYQKALNVTNKSYMKKVLTDNHIPTAKYTVLDSINWGAISEFVFPLVVKPVDCNSSKGVKKVFDKMMLVDALNDAIELSRTHTAIIEEFKEGIEISADFYIQNGDVKLLSVTGSNKIRNTNSFTITQSYYPVLTVVEEDEVLLIAEQIAIAFELDNTPLLVQLIAHQGKFSVLEFSARMGGGSKYKLIECLSGVNIMRVYVDLILGNSPIVSPQKQVNYALMNYIYCNPGIFDRMANLDILKAAGVIDGCFLYKTPGMLIDKSETSGDRPAGFLITADNKEALDAKLILADSTLMVLDDAGNDIMKHGLYCHE